MNENVDIFIGTHRNYTFPTNPIYKIIYNGTEKLDTNLKVYYEENEPLHDLFADVIKIDYIAKIPDLKDYVGIVQYKRYFDFYDNVPDINELFKEYDGIIPSNHPYLIGNNIYSHWVWCMNETPVNECLNIIKKLYSTYPCTPEQLKNINFVNPHNMFILRKDDFFKLHKFLFDILNEYVNMHNFKNIQDVYDYINKNYIITSNNIYKITPKICSYLAELLCSIWYMMNLKNPKYINIIDT